MSKDELQVVDRTYELVKWFLGHLAKFPRSHRYGLGVKIEDKLYGMFEGLIRAKYVTGPQKWKELSAVSQDLEVVRMFVRLADELAILPHKSYEYAVREMAEIGKMVGGWMKQQRQA